MAKRFHNRIDAGRELAAHLSHHTDQPDTLVLGLPRGGVPVAAQVAEALHAPLDVLIVRKLGAPGREELALGAIATGGARFINDEVVWYSDATEDQVEAITEREQRELDRREREYRGDRPPPRIEGRTIILVDDGLATGATMRAAILATRQLQPNRIVAAVPSGSPEAIRDIGREADEVISVITPDPYYSVGSWYEDFGETTDHDVRELLGTASRQR